MLQFLWVVLCFVASLLTWLYCKRNLIYWKKKSIPYEKPLPIIGNTLPVFKGEKNLAQLLADLYRKYDGPYFGIHLFTSPFLVLRDPELIKEVFIKHFNKFSNRTFAANEKVDPVTYYSLLSIPTPQWKPLRSNVTPAFSSGKIKLMLPLIKRCSDDFVRFLEAESGNKLEIKNECVKFITDTIVSCAFGIDANSFKKEKTEFLEAGRKIFKDNLKNNISFLAYFFAPLLVNVFRLKFINASAVEFLRKAFFETIDMRCASKSRRNDLIDLLMDLKNDKKSNEILNLSKYLFKLYLCFVPPNFISVRSCAVTFSA